MTNPGLQDLLVVQGHDTHLDQIRHQMAALPARAERDAVVAQLAATEADHGAQSAVGDDLGRDQKRLDDEIESLSAKRAGYDQRLYGGTVTNPRELQDLQEEIAALGRRITILEDRELEVMEQIEPVDARLSTLSAAVDTQRTALRGAEERLTAAEAELAVALDDATSQRSAAAAAIPADVLAGYDKLRGGLGGIAVAPLVGNQCGGCHLTLSAMEASRLRKLPSDEVAHCEECGRILVP